MIQEGRCQYYCQATNLQCNQADSLCSYDYKHGAKFAGRFGNDNCFEWNDMLGPIVMNVQTICVSNTSNTTYPVPDKAYRYLCPFEKFLGWENTTYVSYNATTPPPSAWSIPDKEYCNPGNDDVCQQFTDIVSTWGPGRAASLLLTK